MEDVQGADRPRSPKSQTSQIVATDSYQMQDVQGSEGPDLPGGRGNKSGTMGPTWSSTSGAVHRRASDPTDQRAYNMLQREARWLDWSPARVCLDKISRSSRFDVGIGVVIMLNIIVMIVEADLNAAAYPKKANNAVIEVTNQVILALYCVEAVLRIYVNRWEYFKDNWNLLDIAIVASGVFDQVITLGFASADLPILSMLPVLRILRVFRLVRAVRLLRFQPQLYTMIVGFLSAMKTMFWGFVLILGLLMFWSLVSVELIYPYVKDLRAESPDLISEWCEERFSGVFNVIVLMFQTLVAGDSWGYCTMPIIEYRRWTFFFFALSLVSVALGFMNLILAVIVDQAAKAREGDKDEQLRQKKETESAMLEEWKAMVMAMDIDGDGMISYSEIMTSYETPKIREKLNLIGIDRSDLHMMFKFIDRDHSGKLDYHELLDALHKAQGQDMRIYLMMLKLQVDNMSSEVRALTKPRRDSRRRSVSSTGTVDGEADGPYARPSRFSTWSAGSAEASPLASSDHLGSRLETEASALSDLLASDFSCLARRLEEQFEAMSAAIEQNTRTLSRHTVAVEGEGLAAGPRGAMANGSEAESLPSISNEAPGPLKSAAPELLRTASSSWGARRGAADSRVSNGALGPLRPELRGGMGVGAATGAAPCER